MISLESKVTTNDKTFTTFVDDDLVLFDPDAGQYFGTGAVGARIWDLASQNIAVVVICDVLTEEYDIDYDTCRTEALRFLGDLEKQGLISVL